jgi:hypothetical protein
LSRRSEFTNYPKSREQTSLLQQPVEEPIEKLANEPVKEPLVKELSRSQLRSWLESQSSQANQSQRESSGCVVGDLANIQPQPEGQGYEREQE